MKKNLLIGIIMLSSLFTARGQLQCETAVAVTAGSTTTIESVHGFYISSCFGGNAGSLSASWYKYTATANGLVTVSSVLPTNPTGSATIGGTDTRLSIFTGECSNPKCYDGNDDVDGVGGDFRSEVVFPVVSGKTYYISWDSKWSSEGFDFSVAFEPSDCLSPNWLSVNQFTEITTNSAKLSWPEIGNPASYDVDYGTWGHVAGTGTIVNTANQAIDLTGLNSVNNEPLDVYIRANCGATQGLWEGPLRLLLVAKLPYSNNFDNIANRADGWFSEDWILSTNEQVGLEAAHSGTGFIFSNTHNGGNQWLFSRPIDVTANEEVTIKFFHLLAGIEGASGSFNVTVGQTAFPEAQETILGSVVIPAPSTYVEKTLTWTPGTSGKYYVAFHNNSPSTAVNGSITIDTISFTSGTAGNEDHFSNAFSIFPNPANDIINITNAENILVNGIDIVDLNGRTIKSVKLDNVTEAQINISDLASGMYMVNITSDKRSMTKKIVKN